tara:strand:- start:489 stop:1619 length:1131 start_codon:yes stop_codon:yes gene_type:complete
MAEDLGTIDISVKSDSQQIEKSFEDGSEKAGKKIGDALSKILGTFAGGLGHATGQAVGAGISVFGMPGSKKGSPGSTTVVGIPGRKGALPGSTPLTIGGKAVGSGKGAGMGAGMARILPLLGKIGLIVGAVGLVTIAIKKLVTVFTNMSSEMESFAHKYAGINAELAQLSAQKQISKFMRDMEFADMVAPVVKSASDSLSRFKDIMNKVTALFKVIGSIIGNQLIGILTAVIESMMGFLRAMLPVIKVIMALTIIIGRVLKILFKFMTNPIKFFWDTLTGKNAHLFDIDSLIEEIERSNEALDRIFTEVEEQNKDLKAQRLNDIFIALGRDLSMGAWSPPQPAISSVNQSNKPTPTSGNTQQKMNRGMGGGGGITG